MVGDHACVNILVQVIQPLIYVPLSKNALHYV